MNELVSIIVPVYNNVKYLESCIMSIKNQLYRNIEIIIVDDGSDKECAALCDKFVDDRTSVYHIKNGGVSKARNFGLEHIGGGYVCFVDSDDIISPFYCEILIDMIKLDNSDVSACSYLNFSDEEEVEKLNKSYTYDDHRCLVRKDVWRNIIENECSVEGYLWNKMFKRSAIGDIRFNEELGMCEDQLFVFQVLSKISRISVCNGKEYYYRYNPKSITHSLTSNLHLQAIYVAEQLLDIVIEDKEIVSKYSSYLADRWYQYCFFLVKKSLFSYSTELNDARNKFIEHSCTEKRNSLEDKKIHAIGKKCLRKSKVIFVIFALSLCVAKKLKNISRKHSVR